MTFLFAHWWTLPILTLAAFLIGVSIAGLAGIKDTTQFGADAFPDEAA